MRCNEGLAEEGVMSALGRRWQAGVDDALTPHNQWIYRSEQNMNPQAPSCPKCGTALPPDLPPSECNTPRLQVLGRLPAPPGAAAWTSAPRFWFAAGCGGRGSGVKSTGEA